MPQETENPPRNCPQCGGEVILFSGISKKTGKPYRFYGCKNPSCNWIFREKSKTEKRHEEIMNALREIWKKIDELEKKINGKTL